MKPCLRCTVAKPHTEFSKNKNRKDGYSNECKACASERYRADPNGKAKRRKHADIWKQANPAATWAYEALRRAKKRAVIKNVDCNLTSKQLMGIMTPKCPVFGTPLIYSGNKVVNELSPSVDRIDPKKGYTIDNIVIISIKANMIKSAYNSADLMTVALWLKKIEDDKA